MARVHPLRGLLPGGFFIREGYFFSYIFLEELPPEINLRRTIQLTASSGQKKTNHRECREHRENKKHNKEDHEEHE
jgi:hypothetical protein